MKQVTQRLRDGRIEVLDVPLPELSQHGVLVDVRASLLSAGTERAKVAAGRQGLIGKARARPDQVQQVLDKARRDGVREAVDAVRSRLNQPASIGYSAAGVVLAVGDLVRDLAPGQRVACGGGDYAVHAEVDHVLANLCVPLPDELDFGRGAFATVGSIALHGVRQAEATVGEKVAVIGLGLVGQLAGQLLRAAGCTVVGVDLSEALVDEARAARSIDVGLVRGALGDELPRAATGCDSVVITAATPSDDPVRLAAQLCRDRGRVVVVGDVGLELPRAPYYDKELDLRLSRSYGPGRYDPEYEERGLDYPIGYVRWTERRNMEAFVELVANGRLNLEPLIRRRVPVERAEEAYEELVSSERSPLAILLEYEPTALEQAAPAPQPRATTGSLRTNVVGAGSFAQRVLIPGLRRAGFGLGQVASARGLSAKAAADRFGFGAAVTPEAALEDPTAGVVVVATRHSSHARLAEEALRRGKAVFVEKPPALDEAELAGLRAARDETGRPLVVGFNRRHAPLAVDLRRHVAAASLPIEFLYRVNAGRLPDAHWLNDPEDGGGRLVGEGCHFVDFACWLVGALPVKVTALLSPSPGAALRSAQSFTIALEFSDGSLGTILYSASGSSRLGKEYVEAHAGGRSAVLDDFKSLRLLGAGRPSKETSPGDKGHVAQLQAFRRLLEGADPAPVPDHLDTMAVTLAALRSASTGASVPVAGQPVAPTAEEPEPAQPEAVR